MNKKKISLIAIVLITILLVLLSLWGKEIAIPNGVDRELWNSSKEINKLIYEGLEDFAEYEVVVNHDRVTFGYFDEKEYLITTKKQKEFSKLIKKYKEVIDNNEYKLNEKELIIYYHTLENVKLYYKLDYLVSYYNLSCLESYIDGEGNTWEEELFLQRQEIVLVLEALKVHGNSLQDYYRYSYSGKIEEIIDKIQSLK